MTTSKMLMIVVIASNMFTLTRADYETNKGFIEGTGYMDQSRNYGYVYYYCGDIKHELGDSYCINSSGVDNLKQDTGFDVKCSCYWIEEDVCIKETNIVIACITPFAVGIFWLVAVVLCGAKTQHTIVGGAMCQVPCILTPCDLWRVIMSFCNICRRREEATNDSNNMDKSNKPVLKKGISDSSTQSNASTASVTSHSV
mgnify:FL=1